MWDEFARVGLSREDVDIQNVVRCFPADREEDVWPPLKMRNPTKEEIRCCSIYNDRALEKSKAKVHIILGQVAAKSLLGGEYTKNKRVFWSRKLRAKVVCLDHPAFFVRGGGHAGAERLKQFRRDLAYAASVAKTGGGKYGFVRAQKHIGVTSIKLAKKGRQEILALARRGRRVSVDIEEGYVDSKGRPTLDSSGVSVPLVVGFCAKPGTTYVYPLQHPDAPVTRRVRRFNLKVVRQLLSNPDVKYAMQRGTYDVGASKKLLGCKVANYDYDTIFGEFFSYPDRHSYALDAIAEARFPEFAGYKAIVAPEAFTIHARKAFKKANMKKAGIDKKYIYARKKVRHGLNLALVPWEKMVVYNGADNDIQKRIEVSTKKNVNMPLMHVYRDAQFVLDRMEKNPPLFDYKQYDHLESHYPVLEKFLYKQLVKMTGIKDFNPNSPRQVSKVLYEKLKLPVIGETPDTRKETMAALAAYHKFPGILTEYRRVKKICTTYLAGFKASADLNSGRVRTIWWLTGTRTGRMSSGGGDSGEDGVVNLQNIHGDPLLQCLLISDPRWREVYKWWREHGDFTEKTWRRFEDIDVFLGFDHSQMELRVLAQKSQDRNLIKAFQSGIDIHCQVGHELTGWSIEEIANDEVMRRIVKNMQFGLVYGLNQKNLYWYMVRKGVYKPLGMHPTSKELRQQRKDQKQVEEFYNRYFDRFSGVARMIEADREFVQEYGYVETLFGFKRTLNVKGDNEGGAYWGNQAINTPIQGSAHQLMLMGLVPLKRKPKTYKLLSRPQLEIHDAIYFINKLKDLFTAAKLGQQMLEKDAVEIVRKDFGIDWVVPLKAEPKAALRFGVQIKDLGGKGPKNEWEFLNAWCKYNQKLQIRMQKEHREMLAKVSAKVH